MVLATGATTACSSDRPLPTLIPTSPVIAVARPPTPLVTGSAGPSLPTPIPPTPTTVPASALAAYTLSVSESVPAELVETARRLAGEQPQIFSWLNSPAADNDDIRPGVILTTTNGLQLLRWVYTVAVPFATVTDGTTLGEVQTSWLTGVSSLGTLILDTDTAAVWSVIWGPPAGSVRVVEPDLLVDALWSSRPSWTIQPFHRLVPQLKVLDLDGVSPIRSGFNALTYPLAVSIKLEGDTAAVNQLAAVWPGLRSNYDPGQITRVAMTGVTALGRATAYQMEIGGITTPGLVVGPVMRAADIAHISHEVSFAPDCPYPNPIGDPIFCARDGYLELILSIGTDVVELTGNHVNDWGPENFVHTLDLYDAAGLKTFGGGRDPVDALDPALFEHNGNKIAFVGCNPVGPSGAWTADGRAGSRPCDYPAFYSQISGLRDQGYLVIATLQYNEFYQYPPTAGQQADFRAVAGAGAAAVSGSQGHHAQGFDFYQGAFIHYGLGNLFFDQMDMLGTRQSFIDTYVIYAGRIISVDLFTGLIENWCCPRQMTDQERAQFLQAVFQASGW